MTENEKTKTSNQSLKKILEWCLPLLMNCISALPDSVMVFYDCGYWIIRFIGNKGNKDFTFSVTYGLWTSDIRYLLYIRYIKYILDWQPQNLTSFVPTPRNDE